MLKCDRCEADIYTGEGFLQIDITHKKHGRHGFTKDRPRKHLCKRCLGAFFIAPAACTKCGVPHHADDRCVDYH